MIFNFSLDILFASAAMASATSLPASLLASDDSASSPATGGSNNKSPEGFVFGPKTMEDGHGAGTINVNHNNIKSSVLLEDVPGPTNNNSPIKNTYITQDQKNKKKTKKSRWEC